MSELEEIANLSERDEEQFVKKESEEEPDETSSIEEEDLFGQTIPEVLSDDQYEEPQLQRHFLNTPGLEVDLP